jgi:hypothetical protein
MKRRLLPLFLVVALFWAAVPVLAEEPTFASYCEDISADSLEPSKECLAIMESFPEPVTTYIDRDLYTLNTYSFWQVVSESPTLFDAPGGNPIGQMGAGFNFVHAVDFSEGWVKNRQGAWMSTDDLKYHEASYFRGVNLLNGLHNRFGWVLGDLMTVPEPGAPQSMDTGVYKPRYALVNIFAEVRHEDGWLWYMVGPNQWIEQRSIALAQPVERPEEAEDRWVAIDLYEQTLIAYEGDTPVYATLIATGLPGTETREGLFEVWARLENDKMSGAAGAPTAYDLEGIPWIIYFDGNNALHGTYWHDGFGYRRSRGCVNLSISDARFIYDWTAQGQNFDEDGNLITHVYVYASGQYGGSGPATK